LRKNKSAKRVKLPLIVLIRNSKMPTNQPEPGVSRAQRLSDAGLARLQQQLSSGVNMTDLVLEQWIRRYGDAARELIRKHGRYTVVFDRIENPLK
jgi:hypothetical protein